MAGVALGGISNRETRKTLSSGPDVYLPILSFLSPFSNLSHVADFAVFIRGFVL